jgi:hypothetical protein
MSHPVLDLMAKRSQNISWITDRTILLVRHGSHAYGTNTDTSDEDFKGVTIPPKEYFFSSFKRFEQAELKAPDPDAVVYDVRKFINLASDCNPNIIEVLHTSDDDHFVVSPLGRTLLENKDIFLSKKIKHTFTGYAVSQLHRIKLHRRWLLNPPTELPTRESLGLPKQPEIPKDQLLAAQAEIQKELDRFQFDFMEGLEESAKINIRSVMSDMLGELKITSDEHWMAAARKIGLNDNFVEIMQKERAYVNSKKEWDKYQEWRKNRNEKRAALEAKFGYDTKHAYHLVRLIRMCREILTTGKVIVKRPDREELLAIRNGAWTYDRLIEFADTEDAQLNELYNSCKILPHSPDREKIDKLCINLIEQSLIK